MPYRKKTNRGIRSKGFDGSNVNKIQTDTHNIIEAKKSEFYELEAFQVEEILLQTKGLPNDDYSYYGAIRGKWLNNIDQPILPIDEEWVLPLDPHIKKYPLTGENVVCVNYLGRTYYSTILNHQNNPNNNIMTGLSKKGPSSSGQEAPAEISTVSTFNKPLPANMGDIIIQGRFGNSINIGSQDMVGSSIKLVAHGRENPTYDLEKDAASIYIQDGGSVTVKNPNSKLGSNIVTGKKIVLDADYIVINAKKQLKLQGADLVEVVGGNTEIKHNKGGKIVTGETEKAVDELRERVKKKLKDEFDKKLLEFLEATAPTREAFNKAIQDLKDLDDKMKDAIEDVEEKIEMFRNTSFTFNATKFTEIQDKVNRLQQQLSEQVPILRNGAPNPEFIRLTKDLLDVFRSFVTLDFINKDIVTIEQKK